MTIDCNGDTNFPRKLVLTDAQVLSLRKAFGKSSSANKKLQKTQLSKTVELWGFIPLSIAEIK